MITNKTMSDYIVRLFHRYITTKALASKLELQEVLYRYVGRLIYDYSASHEEAGDDAVELLDLLFNIANRLIELAGKEVNEKDLMNTDSLMAWLKLPSACRAKLIRDKEQALHIDFNTVDGFHFSCEIHSYLRALIDADVINSGEGRVIYNIVAGWKNE